LGRSKDTPSCSAYEMAFTRGVPNDKENSPRQRQPKGAPLALFLGGLSG
jgi:hypothetical protein